jgi:hypothetical protein
MGDRTRHIEIWDRATCGRSAVGTDGREVNFRLYAGKSSLVWKVGYLRR